MSTSALPRRLPVGDTYNLRDVGGYPTAGGSPTAWERLYRSDAAAFAGSDVRELGLRTVIDLRDDAELLARPTGLDALGPAVMRRPLTPRLLLTRVTPDTPDPLGELYVALLRERGTELAAIVSDLARPGALPALVHCAAGKDRTGVVIALVLSAIGVAEEVVVADYALTADYLTAEFFAAVPAESGAADPHDEVLRGADPASMAAMLRVLASEYGGARRYLVGHGVPDEAIDALRTSLTH